MEKKRVEPIFVVLRHGERADYAGDTSVKYDIKFDPPLTVLGHKQARISGEFLRKTLALGEREVVLYSSPLLRTMQTSGQVLQALGLQASHKILPSNCFCEELYTSEYPVDPQTNCALRKWKHEKYVKEKLQGVEFEDQEEMKKLKFPESYKETTNRMISGFSELVEKYKDSTNTAVIIVGHGRVVDEFNSYFFASPTCCYLYCTTSAVKFDGHKFTKIFCNHTAHIPSSLQGTFQYLKITIQSINR